MPKDMVADGKERMMKLFKSIDERIERIGYKKIKEGKYGTSYEKIEPQGYIHKVDICHKADGRHLMFSFTNSFDVVGLTYNELLLFVYKFFLLKLRWRFGQLIATKARKNRYQLTNSR